MSDPTPLPRPRQVTVIGWFAIAMSLLLVISVFDAMGSVRSVDSRRNLESFLSKSPGSGLGITVDQAMDLLRLVVLLTGALAAAAFVQAIYVLRRHNGARITFTVTAALLLLAAPVAGFLPVTIAVAAAMLWSPPARDWFAGRTSVEAPARRNPFAAMPSDREQQSRPVGQPPDQSTPPPAAPEPPVAPPPSPYPFGQPPGAGVPPPYPYGQQPGPEGDVPPPAGYPQLPPPGMGYPPPAPGYPTYQQLPPGAGYPGPLGGVPGRRPATVTAAAIITWIATGLTAAFCVIFGAVVASTPSLITDQLAQDPSYQDLDISDGAVVTIMLVMLAIGVLWSVASFVLAIFVYRGAGWARIALTVSASATVVLSVLTILSLVSLITLGAAAAVIVLLFTGGASPWFASRSSRAGQPRTPVW